MLGHRRKKKYFGFRRKLARDEINAAIDEKNKGKSEEAKESHKPRNGRSQKRKQSM